MSEYLFVTENGDVVAEEYNGNNTITNENGMIEQILQEALSVNGNAVSIDNPVEDLNDIYKATIQSPTEEYCVYFCVKGTTPGGRNGLRDEQRIQPQAKQINFIHRKFEEGCLAVNLGIYKRDNTIIFCAWKQNPSNASPNTTISKQIKIGSIASAVTEGIFRQNKGRGEYACAFRKEFLYFYIKNSSSLHGNVITENIENHTPEAVNDVIENNSIAQMIDSAINNGYQQIILTGAPGTGKTYSVNKYVRSYIENDNSRMQFVQFHPSYDYTDFVEGLRPIALGDENNIDNAEPTFVRLDGIFKQFCRDVVTANCEELEIETTTEIFFSEYNSARENSVQTKYFFIIDEINRADLSRVFGELMFCLEESYRGVEYKVQTQYRNLKTYNPDTKRPIEFDCFEKGFFIPKNVYIIGTMNDIDKSVEAFDFALRRRFEWIDVKANDVLLEALTTMYGEDITEEDIQFLANQIIQMNNYISADGARFGLSDAYHIGHAYFKKLDVTNGNESIRESVEKIFDTNIASILREYTRGRDASDFINNCKNELLRNYITATVEGIDENE